MVEVPIGEPPRNQTAIVIEVDVPEAEIATYRDRVKTIPVRSRIATVLFKPEEAAASPEEIREAWKETKTLLERSYIDQQGEEQGSTPEEEPDLPIGGLAEAAQKAGADVTVSEVHSTEESWPARTALINIYPDEDAVGLYREGQKLLQYALDRVIITNEDLKPATDDLTIIAKTRKALEAKRVDMSKPIREYLNKVQDGFKRMLEPFDDADKLTRGQIIAFSAEQSRKVAEAHQIEADKLDLARREAAFNGTGEHTQELETIVAPPEAPRIIRTDMGTVSGRTIWKAEVVDFALLPDEYKLPNEQLLRSFANSTKGTREIPGVRIFSESGLTVRAKQGQEA